MNICVCVNESVCGCERFYPSFTLCVCICRPNGASMLISILEGIFPLSSSHSLHTHTHDAYNSHTHNVHLHECIGLNVSLCAYPQLHVGVYAHLIEHIMLLCCGCVGLACMCGLFLYGVCPSHISIMIGSPSQLKKVRS